MFVALLAKYLRQVFLRPLFLFFLAFTVAFDAGMSSYVLHVSSVIFKYLHKYLHISAPLFYDYIFLGFLYSVFVFSFTMLAVDLPLDSFSRDLQTRAAEIYVKYFSRARYFFSRFLAIIIILFIYIFIHVFISYLIFRPFIDLNLEQVLLVALGMFYALLIILSCALVLDLLLRKSSLVPTFLGTLNMLAGFLVLGTATTNFSACLAGYLSIVPAHLPSALKNIYGILARIGKYSQLFAGIEKFGLLLFPFYEYFKLTLFFAFSPLVPADNFSFFFGLRLTLLDLVFPFLWTAAVVGMAWLYFYYKDI
ncbi:MAG: hypothetical protein GXO42_02830 [bacterium]|nr:hypothetical protein [bacterium]